MADHLTPAGRLHILVVDDSRTALKHVSAILEELGHAVTMAESGRDALGAVVRTRFDVIMCDLVMPDMDGMTVLQRLKEHRPETPIIIFTAHGTMDSAIEALRRGADDFLTKPIEIEQVRVRLKALEQAMEGRRLRAEHTSLRAAMATAAAAAHEINQPLTALLTAAEMISRSDDMGEMRDLAKMIGEQSTRLGQVAWRLANITTYRTTPYVDDTEILDLEASSR